MSYEPELSLKHWVQDEIDRRVKSSAERLNKLEGWTDYLRGELGEKFGAVVDLFKENDARFEDIANRVKAAFRKDAKKLKKLKGKNARLEGELLKALQRIEVLEKLAGIR